MRPAALPARSYPRTTARDLARSLLALISRARQYLAFLRRANRFRRDRCKRCPIRLMPDPQWTGACNIGQVHNIPTSTALPSAVKPISQIAQKIRQGQAKTKGNDLESSKGYAFLPTLDLADVASVHSQHDCHIDLCHPARVAQLAKLLAKAGSYVQVRLSYILRAEEFRA